MTNVVGLIPARAGSERVKDKNIRLLNGHPMIAYTICSAIDSGVFDDVIVSTDSEKYADIAKHYGAIVPFLRPEEMAGSKSPDIEWIQYTLEMLADNGHEYDCFSILRPTSPFRSPKSIKRAWDEFMAEKGCDSLRAVEKCSQHPGKMWVLRDNRMLPVLPYELDGTPWHSSQYKALPEIYVQNAALEIAWTKIALEAGSIAGATIMPFVFEGNEAVDINTEEDWFYTEHLIKTGAVKLPEITVPAYKG